MAEEASGGLTQTFKKAAKWVGHHLFSPTMIFMMAAMALPGLAAAAGPGAATLGDLGMYTWAHFKAMFSGFIQFDTVGDIVSNAWNGNFTPNLDGVVDPHAAMGHGAGAHVEKLACKPFAEWSAGIDPESLKLTETKAYVNGVTTENQYIQDFCK